MIGATSLLPIHDENPTRRFSYLTVALILINVGAFFLQPGLGSASPDLLRFFYRWALVPWEVTRGHPVTAEALSSIGIVAQGCSGICFPEKSVYLSIVTSMFLHGDFLHIGGNMLFLWIFGNNIEDVLGRVRFILFYLATGTAAALAHVAINADSLQPTVGASGAVSGILGAYLVLFPHARITTLMLFLFIQVVRLPAIVVLGIWFLSQFLIAAQQPLTGGGGVAWMAHVGGFIAGAILILPFRGRILRRRVPDWWR